MSNAINLANMRFGRLVVLSRTENIGANVAWLCLCDCGNKHTVAGAYLRRGASKSCGCLCKEEVSKAKATHRMSNSPEFTCWAAFHQRCYNQKNKSFANYGGRGIEVDAAWHAFEQFFADMGPKPSPKHSLDRIDNNKNYGSKNCRWATAQEQTSNRRSNRLITIDGEVKTVTQWSRLSGIPWDVIGKRIGRGWSAEQAVFKPLRVL